MRPRWRWPGWNAHIGSPQRMQVRDGFFQFRDAQPRLLINPSSRVRLHNYHNWSAENDAATCDFTEREPGTQIVLSGGPAAGEAALCSPLQTR